jgi:chromosome segregation ATPase
LADTIKVLNDDSALDLFKKALPSASASFLQVKVDMTTTQKSALAVVQSIRSTRSQHLAAHRPQLDFITLALHGKPAGFDKVIAMIDGMVKTLEKEQHDDQHKKEYCTKQFDLTQDKKQGLQKVVSDNEIAIEESTEALASLAAEIKALTDSIKGLDKSVAEATEQRKAEHEDFTQLMASDASAKELLKFAMNRLNKFYSPKLYNPPPKRELSDEDQIIVNNGGTLAPTAAPGGIAGTGISFAQVYAHDQEAEAPEPPPEALGAYSKKGDEGTGVVAMIQVLIKDLDKEMSEAEETEKDAQSDYERMLNDAAEKRATDSKALTEKSSAKGTLESDIQAGKDAKLSSTKELMATDEYLGSLHSECDWLLQYFDVRAEARTSEIEGLGKAKSILSGTSLSLLQERSARNHFMQRRAGI